MQIWAADRRSEREVRSQSAREATHRMDVTTQIIDHRARSELLLGRAKRASLSKPPVRRSDIKALAVKLIDHHHASGLQERREVSTGCFERINVVQGNHRDSSIES